MKSAACSCRALGYGYYDADIAVRSGVDSMLNPMNIPDATVTDTTSPTAVLAMRESSHHILYTVVNSRAYAGNTAYSMELWKKILIGVDVVLALLLILAEVCAIRKYRRKKAA